MEFQLSNIVRCETPTPEIESSHLQIIETQRVINLMNTINGALGHINIPLITFEDAKKL